MTANSVGAPGMAFAANFSDLTDLDPVLTEIFYQQYEMIQSRIPALFGMRTSTKGKETDKRLAGFPTMPQYKGQIDYIAPEDDYEVSYTFTEFAQGFKVERAMADDNQYDGIFSSAQELATSAWYIRETTAANVFNNATSNTGYDATSLVANSHPNSKADTANTQDNYLALALSVANLDTARQAMRAFKNEKNQLIAVNPDTLLVPPALERTAYEITVSERNPENAENAANFWRSKLNVVVWDFLTDSNRWFLIDSMKAKRYLKWYDRTPLEFYGEADRVRTAGDRFYNAYQRFGTGYSDWRWVLGSEPS